MQTQAHEILSEKNDHQVTNKWKGLKKAFKDAGVTFPCTDAEENQQFMETFKARISAAQGAGACASRKLQFRDVVCLTQCAVAEGVTPTSGTAGAVPAAAIVEAPRGIIACSSRS